MCRKGAWPRLRDLLFKFWDPSNITEWLKIQTSNFACGLKVGNTKVKNQKLVSTFLNRSRHET